LRLLLDTHAFLWFEADNPNLPRAARDEISAEFNEVFFSIASIWEIAIKVSLGKLSIEGTLEELIAPELADNTLSLLPIQIPHLVLVAGMSFHHRDPFDRLLAAQCLREGMAIVSRDPLFEKYGVRRIWQ
jgi:PIN domain nuclease of toxin-antitoxin system